MKVMATVEVFREGQGQKVKKKDTMWNVLSQVIHIWKVKDLLLRVWKLWPRLKFSKVGNISMSRQQGKIMLPFERYCHKEYIHKIPFSYGWKVMNKVQTFVFATNADAGIDAYMHTSAIS